MYSRWYKCDIKHSVQERTMLIGESDCLIRRLPNRLLVYLPFWGIISSTRLCLVSVLLESCLVETR